MVLDYLGQSLGVFYDCNSGVSEGCVKVSQERWLDQDSGIF